MSAQQMKATQAELVQRVFVLTQAINEASQLSDWQRAARLAEERSPLVHQIRPDQDPASLQLIRDIQSMNSAIAEEAHNHQAELTKQYQAVVKRANAAQQYNRVALF